MDFCHETLVRLSRGPSPRLSLNVDCGLRISSYRSLVTEVKNVSRTEVLMTLLGRLTPFLILATTMACSSLPIIGRAKREVWSFAAPWDMRSTESVKAHGASLDGIVSGWITLDSLTGEPTSQFADSLFAPIPSGTEKLMLVTSFAGERFHPATIR